MLDKTLNKIAGAAGQIVGQIGYASDWEGNRQPHPDLYQRHLREAWDGGTPAFGWGMPGGPENQ